MTWQGLWPIPYASIPQEIDDSEVDEKNRPIAKPIAQKLLWLGGLGLLVVASGFVGFSLGRAESTTLATQPELQDVVPQVAIGLSRETFRLNQSFANPPPESGGSEPVWDSLIPNGLGYVKHPDLAPDLSVISAFHQLHCLYTIRRAYYSTAKTGQLEDFDFGRDRKQHTGHCFEYLRQSIMCSADSSVEPAANVEGFLGWGFPRQCRDFGELRDWTEDSRAFDGHGFLAADLLHNHRA